MHPRKASSKKLPRPEPGATPDATTPHALLARLTRREVEVLRWVVEGKRDAEIARILGTSVNTIHKHVQHILAKLGVETRTAAARIALSGGDSRNGS